MVGRDCDVNLRASSHPEFDAWRWHDYWVPLDTVIEFKRGVYQLALQELSRFLRQDPHRKPHGRHQHKTREQKAVQGAVQTTSTSSTEVNPPERINTPETKES